MPGGVLFDIQRFGLHDGPGIRTVVFFQGCPLRCRWCHNPESQAMRAQIRYRAGACAGCGACAGACPRGAHRVSEAGHGFDRSRCAGCEAYAAGACPAAEACLYEALQVNGRAWTAEQVMETALRDRAYYAASGGGITLTGGEPLAQPAFCLELLGAAREAGLHTCLETCGQVGPAWIERALPLVDVWLWDYKATGAARHQALTGVDGRRARANLDLVLARGGRVWLRCPLVAGVNDGEDHLRAIAALAEQAGIEQVDVLAYHNVGAGKYAEYGMEDPLPGRVTTAEDVKAGWLRDLHELGCAKARVG
jgi:pyruvate formate lyase activating enzyme